MSEAIRRGLFHVRRPGARSRCGVCGRPWSWYGHAQTHTYRMECDRCGSTMDHWCCYGRFFGLTEEKLLECDDEELLELLFAYLDGLDDEGNYFFCSVCQN